MKSAIFFLLCFLTLNVFAGDLACKYQIVKARPTDATTNAFDVKKTGSFKIGKNGAYKLKIKGKNSGDDYYLIANTKTDGNFINMDIGLHFQVVNDAGQVFYFFFISASGKFPKNQKQFTIRGVSEDDFIQLDCVL